MYNKKQQCLVLFAKSVNGIYAIEIVKKVFFFTYLVLRKNSIYQRAA